MKMETKESILQRVFGYSQFRGGHPAVFRRGCDHGGIPDSPPQRGGGGAPQSGAAGAEPAGADGGLLQDPKLPAGLYSGLFRPEA